MNAGPTATSPGSSGASAVRVFASAHGNAFMAEIGEWIVEAAQQLGRVAELVTDGSLPSRGAGREPVTNLVIAPHEFYLLGEYDDAEIAAAAAASIPVCTEQPGTPWFEMTALLAAASPAALDINRHGVDALRERGIAAEHLRLGAVPSMDRRAAVTGRDVTGGDVTGRDMAVGDVTGRDIDVTFLAGLTTHRGEQLAHAADVLAGRRTELRMFTNAVPITGPIGGVVFGADKHELLARTRVLLNIHRSGDSHYFEWARVVEAMANGVVVVTEPSTGVDPLVPGEHFLVAEPGGGQAATGAGAAAVIEALLDDPDRCAEIGAAAADAVLHRFPLSGSLDAALQIVEPQLEAAAAAAPSSMSGSPRYAAELRRAQQVPLLPAFRPYREVRRELHTAWAAERSLQRRIGAARATLRHGRADAETLIASPAFAADGQPSPEVSVIVTLFDYADVVTDTLDSIAASTDATFEIVIVDDHSRDDGRAVVADWIDRNPGVAALLVGLEANRGLPAARNRAIAAAHADKLMVVDADNLLRPNCLRRLADALDADPAAAMAYGILERFGAETGVQSALGWHPAWLCAGNYIDAQAMVRRSTFERLGGYRDDPLVHGWEDWDLWLRIAAAGEHGAHVAEFLGRYRTQESSMIATSNLFGDVMLDELERRYPSLPWPTR